MMTGKKILDVTCANRSIWFNKNHPAAVYCDIREVDIEKRFGSNHSLRKIHIRPDIVCDFRSLPFEDSEFALVVFDPPHSIDLEDTAWTTKHYGSLTWGWEVVLLDGFRECMRVLKPDGVLVLKWSDVHISTRDLINAIGQEPLFGHRSGKKMNTHWLCFMKIEEEQRND
jgi:SAM-dependent methyltransferase